MSFGVVKSFSGSAACLALVEAMALITKLGT